MVLVPCSCSCSCSTPAPASSCHRLIVPPPHPHPTIARLVSEKALAGCRNARTLLSLGVASFSRSIDLIRDRGHLPQDRYAAMAAAASKYGVLQYGITLFTWAADKGAAGQWVAS